MIDVVPNAGVIALGKQGENQAVRVTLPNIRAGSGSILLLHQRSDDQKPYPVPVVEADGGIIWTVSSTDTAYPGRGQAELQWLGADGAVVKSVTYQTNTIRALTTPGSVPDEPLKPYTQAVAKDAQAAKNAAASATEAARSAEAIVGQAGQSAQSAQAAALAAAQNAAAAETAEDGAKQAQTGAEAARTEAQTAKTAAEKAAQEAKTAQAGAVEAKTGAETAQVKAEEAAQGVAADREQIRANTAGLEAAKQDVTALKTENTALKAKTARTARSLDYLWKKSKGIVYDTETVTGTGSSVTVPSGAMDYAALRKLGGMSQRGEGNNVLIDAQVDEVRVQGRNLLNLLDGVTVSNNVTINVNGGEVNIRGTPPDIGFIFLLVTYTAPAPATYTIAVNSSEQNDAARLIFSVNAGGYISAFPKRTFTVAAGDIVRIYIRISTVANYDVTFRPVIVTGLFADTTFAPYREPITYPIPQTIRDMCPDYGQGTAESYNYIDFAAKAYHHVGSMAPDGTWTALETPEIIDLSAVWPDDDFGVLQVEAGGTINLHYPAIDNGFELAVPSETEIMVDVAKVVQTNG